MLARLEEAFMEYYADDEPADPTHPSEHTDQMEAAR